MLLEKEKKAENTKYSFFSWFISHFLNCLWNQRSLMSHTSLQGAFLAVGKSVWKQKLVRVFFFMKIWYVWKVLLSKDNANKTTWRKFSMSEALPVIFLLHFGHSGWFRPTLVTFLQLQIWMLMNEALNLKVLLASLTNVMSIDTVEDLGRRRHLVKANLE